MKLKAQKTRAKIDKLLREMRQGRRTELTKGEAEGLVYLQFNPPTQKRGPQRAEGGSALFVGDRENPRKVPVWRENHVKAADGSLQRPTQKRQRQRNGGQSHLTTFFKL